MKLYISIILLSLVFSNLIYGRDFKIKTIKLTGQVHKGFNNTHVQIKDSFGQIFKIPRTSFSKNFKFKSGKIFSITIKKDLLIPDSKYIYITR